MNTVDMQSQEADKGWSSSFGGWSILQNVTSSLALGQILWNNLSNGNWTRDSELQMKKWTPTVPGKIS
jgi:hypothetical protein